MASKKLPSVFSEDEITEVMKKAETRTIKQQIYESVKGVVDDALWNAILSPTIFNVTDGNVVRTDMPNVYFRKKTLLALIDTFREQIKNDQYPQVLFEAGEKVGMSFAEDFIKLLHDKNCIPNPKDHGTLLKTWALFDSSAGMGWISIESYNGDEIKVKIKDSFLIFGYSKEIHRHCSFFEGYIYGTLNELFHEFYGWIDETQTFRMPSKRQTVVQVNHSQDSSEPNVCHYHVLLAEDKFIEAHTHGYAAVVALQRGDLNTAITEARAVLETCVKRALGLKPYAETSFYRITKTLNERKILQPQLIKTAERLYSELSGVIHGKKATTELGRTAIDFSRMFANALERALASLPKVAKASVG